MGRIPVTLGIIGAAVVFAMAAVRVMASDGGGHQPLSTDHAYLFTQQHRDNLAWWNESWMPQTVPTGAHVQIQLPSAPAVWIPDAGPACRPSPTLGLDTTGLPRGQAVLLGGGVLPNEDRMTGSSEISFYDYRVEGSGLTVICLRPEPADADPEALGFPSGTTPYYLLTLLVGVPQVNLR